LDNNTESFLLPPAWKEKKFSKQMKRDKEYPSQKTASLFAKMAKLAF